MIDAARSLWYHPISGISASKAIKAPSQPFVSIRQNLFWAFIYNLTGMLPIAAGSVISDQCGLSTNPMIAGAANGAWISASVVSKQFEAENIQTLILI